MGAAMARDNHLRRRVVAAAGTFGRALALTLLLGLFAQGSVAQPLAGGPDERMALVIGNANYSRAALKNPVNDARAVAAALRELGYGVVYRENAAQGDMIDAMREFALKSANSQVRIVFYAGHGAQLKGRNYLVPVDASFKDEEEVPLKTANVSELIDRLGQAKDGVNIVILDACRNTPFPLATTTRGLTAARSLAPGLAPVAAPLGAKGTLIAYSTAPGSIALDGPGNNSAFTRHLLANMQIPGLPVEQLFKRVRIAVSEETQQVQIPWETSSLRGDFCFRSAANGECLVTDSTVASSGTGTKDKQVKTGAR